MATPSELRAEVERRRLASPVLKKNPTSPGGSRFESVKAERNRAVAELRDQLIQEGFSRESVIRATEGLRETRTAVKRDIEGRQARLKPFEAKLRKEVKAKAIARGEIVATPAELAKIKAEASRAREKDVEVRKRSFRLAKKAKPKLLISSRQPRRLEVEKAAPDFPTGFVPGRPVDPGETTQLLGPEPEPLFEKFGTGAEIRAGGLKQQDFIFRDEITEENLLGLQAQAKVQKQQKLATALVGGGAAAFEAELILTGVPKAIKSIPEVLAFGALTFVSPPIAAIVGTAALATSIPGLQKEILGKGLLRTTASELPTIAAFTLAGAAGARLRTTQVVRGAEFDIKIEDFLTKGIDPKFTFEAKPFAIISEGKPPAFLQRTLRGDVRTPSQLDLLLREVRLREEIPKPETRSQLKKVLGQIEARQPLTKEQARQLDILRPEIEEFLLVEPGRKGLVTPGKLGIKPMQLQLRESFPTVAQKGEFLLSQLPIISKPSKQLTFFPPGKRGQAGLTPQELQFDIGEILKGVGEGLREGAIKFKGPELPRVAVTQPIRSRLGFFPGTSTEIFGAVSVDNILQQQAAQQQGLNLLPVELQQPRQKLESLLDLDILQDQITGVSPIQDVFQEQLLDQQQKQRALLVEDILLDTIAGPPRVPGRPGKPPKRPMPPKLINLGLGGIVGPAASIDSFDVFVREGITRRDKFIKANAEPLPKNKALNLGADIVDNTTAAAFKIKKKGKTKQKDDISFLLDEKFRRPKGKTKLEKNVFVEENKHRIDSAGELLGIPFKARGSRSKAIENLLKTNRGGIIGI